MPSFFSHSTVPKLVVRRMFTVKDASLLHLLESVSISEADGKDFASTPDFGFWTCREYVSKSRLCSGAYTGLIEAHGWATQDVYVQP